MRFEWPRVRALAGLLVGTGLIGALFLSGKIRENASDIYEVSPTASRLAASKIAFEEVSVSLGVIFSHKFYFPNSRLGGGHKNFKALASMAPAVSVADVDGDGYMDIYVSAAQRGVPNLLFHNVKGAHFEEIGTQMHVANVNDEDATSFSVFADFNGDGNMDLLIGKWGCHQLFKGGRPGQPFQEISGHLHGYCSNPNSIGVADLNHDGYLDLIFGNFKAEVDLHYASAYEIGAVGRGDKISGGQNHILFGRAHGDFDTENRYEFPSFDFTHAVGLTDLNRDSYPDVLFADDHAADELYINHQGEYFEEITKDYIPIEHHGFSSMNSEIFDYNGDGRPDLFITNGYKPPYRHTGNVLWERLPAKDQGFKEVAWQRGVARCGFAWAAKFADFDLDGEPDLMVLNGRSRSETIHPEKGASSIWYQRYLTAAVPLSFTRKFMRAWKYIDSNFYMSADEHSCLFQQKDGQFYDVAEHAGIRDLENGRGLALIDYDNDGLMDMVVVNIGGPALVYHNVSRRQGEWIGFDLDGGKGRRIPFGARLEFKQAARSITREIFPTNGNKAQSDPRVVVGLGWGNDVGTVLVTWPDGQREEFRNSRKNTYNRLIRGKGQGVARQAKDPKAKDAV